MASWIGRGNRRRRSKRKPVANLNLNPQEGPPRIRNFTRSESEGAPLLSFEQPASASKLTWRTGFLRNELQNRGREMRKKTTSARPQLRWQRKEGCLKGGSYRKTFSLFFLIETVHLNYWRAGLCESFELVMPVIQENNFNLSFSFRFQIENIQFSIEKTITPQNLFLALMGIL